jgi:hypothetical protein
MQVNPLFDHDHVIQDHDDVIIIVQPPEETCCSATKIVWLVALAFLLINVTGVLAAYLVTKSFADWFTIACMCTTGVGAILLIVLCLRYCFQCLL